MTYTCPVCGYPELKDIPDNYEICPSCGTEFGYTDFNRSYAELRVGWISRGMPWHSQVVPQPKNWNSQEQLARFTVTE